MIFCPNKNLPEWKELVDRLGDEDLAYFEWNRKYGDFNQAPVKTIKNGVPELFDSNPELANAVYEALGFKNAIIEIPDKYELDKEYNLKSVLNNLLNTENKSISNIYKLLLNSISSDLKLIYSKNIRQDANGEFIYLEDVIKINPNKLSHKTLIHEIIHALTHDTLLKNEEFNNKITVLRKQAIQYFENNRPRAIQGSTKSALASNDEFLAGLFNYKNLDFLDTLNNIPSENTTLLEKIKNVFKNLINEVANIAGIKLNENSLLYEVINELGAIKTEQITPQQKQQALQLYSQYLDTIFPDSKVKDIVYRGDNTTNYNKEKTGVFGKGIYFSQSKVLAKFHANKIKGEVKAAVLNSKNPNTEYYFHPDFNTKKGYKNIYAGVELNKNEDSIIGLRADSLGEIKEYVVFEPEQIHILGSKQDIEGFKEFTDKVNQADLALEHQETFTMEELSAMMYENAEIDFNTEELVDSPIDKLYDAYSETFSENQISKGKLEELLSKGVSVNSIEEWTKSCLIGGGKGAPKAKDGMSFNFTPGGKWKLVKDLQGYPTHEKGGVDLYIGKNGVSMASGESSLMAEKGLVMPNQTVSI